MCGITDLPNELVIEILLWLPAKSVGQFKSVCKHCRSLFDEPDFVAKHHERSNRYFLIEAYDNVSQENNLSLVCRETLRVVSPEDKPQLYLREEYHRLFPSCNGIFCVEFCYRYFALWSPATGEIKILLSIGCLNYSSPGNDQNYYNSDYCLWDYYVGCGFDAKGNDYKVLMIYVPDLNNYTYDPERVLLALVYKLSNNSWRKEVITLPRKINMISTLEFCIDGMFFLFVEDIDKRRMIYSFDYGDETFMTTLLPDGYYQSNCSYDKAKNFFALNGNIALINHDLLEGLCKLWVLSEIGNKESWTKLCEFEPCSDLNLPLGNLREDELFLKSKSGELVLRRKPVNPALKLRLQHFDEDIHSEVF